MPILCGESNQVTIAQNGTDFTYFSSLLLPAAEDALWGEDAETCDGHNGDGEAVHESLTMDGQTAPSPQSEAVTEDLQELSLHHGSNIQNPRDMSNATPLTERKNVLQLKLQQRRTREELVNQGIMPPLKSSASFHEQRRSLERARTEDYLKRKIKCRPERSELVRMHILEETSAEPSLQAKQLKLKRARLADDLNEKISQRPGPMELVVKNILPVEKILKEVIIDDDYSKVADSSSFDEDSSDALSPEQPASQDSHGSVPSPSESKVSEGGVLFSPTQSVIHVQPFPEFTEKSFISDISHNTALNISNGLSVPANKPLPALIKSHSKAFPEKSLRTKKTKEPKPKVKKLKYHQYIPPDQKQKGTPAMDSSYAKILQQQQLFLQLQILNQQQHQHYNYHTILPAPPKPLPDQQTAAINSTPTVLTLPTISTSSSTTSPVVRQNNMATFVAKIGRLPQNLDDMKVAELKQELKYRGLHVSGTKVDLIERLKATQDLLISSTPLKSTANQPPKPNEMVPIVHNATASTTESPKLGNFNSTPPCSPCPSEVSITSMEEVATTGEIFTETVPSPVTSLTIHSSPPPEKSPPCGSDKDIMLREKDRQIEELTRRLKQKQELVEKLRQQLEHEKKTQQLQLWNDEQTASAQEKELSIPTTNSENISEPLTTKPVIKSEIKMNSTCQQEQKVFLNAVPKVNESKVHGSSATQLFFTLSGPNTLLSDDNQQVLFQGPSPHVQLGPATVLSFTISSNTTEPLLNKICTEKTTCNSVMENPVSCLQKKVDTQSTPPQPKHEPPSQSIFVSTPSLDWIKEVPDLDDLVAEEPSDSEEAPAIVLKVDDFFDVLMHNLDLDTTSKEFPVPCLKQSSSTHPSENVGTQKERNSLPSSSSGQLEDLLETSAATPIHQGDQDVTSSLPLIDDLHSQMLSSLAILDHPNSMDTSDLHFSSGTLGLDTCEPPLDGMDWLELSGPPAMNLTPLSTATPSVFCTDFLDSNDLQLHWDSCL